MSDESVVSERNDAEELRRIQSAHKYHADFLDILAKSLSEYAPLVESLPNRGWSGSDGGCRRDMAKSLLERASDLRRHAAFARSHFNGDE